MKKIFHKYKYIYISACVIVFTYIFIPLPELDDPKSTAVYSQDGLLMGAKIASDEQWRFPEMDSIPNKIENAIIIFEDKYFRYHPGFNPISIFRSLLNNIKAREVVSGGSTITMQVIRLGRKGKSRTIKEKMIEMLLATKLELKYSKNKILSMYLSNAPFGGNVVGIEAASWRYYGRSPDNLSWAESATLAVLPNAPSLIFPGKNQNLLLTKRNRLLNKLLINNIIDSLTYNLSLKENLPGTPKNLPRIAPHLTEKCNKEYNGKRTITTIDYDLQQKVNNITRQYIKTLKANEIHNIAVLVVEISSASIKCYIGNSYTSKEHANDVDIIHARRSTGSILKPILYASMLNDGELLPNMLIPDIPMFMDGFSPKNYNLSYDGAVPAKKALSRSLNVPSVYLLSDYTVDRFHDKLKQLHFSTINYPPDHYGLSLILGGAETTLWDLCKVYTGMSRILKFSVERNYLYSNNDLTELNYNLCIPNKNRKTDLSEIPEYFNAASVWFTLDALLEVNRPENETGWKFFSSSNKIAWKTGTSFGFRDAWAIGMSSEYVVGVWVGNADGEGRPGLVGVLAAAPVLFDIFDLLPKSGWFEEPYQEIKDIQICKQSGFIPSVNCTEFDTISVPSIRLKTMPCKYHKLINLDITGKYRVNSTCENPEQMLQKSWFILPPAMEYYYKLKNPFYLPLPPYKPGCKISDKESIMEFIYPKENSKIYIPVDIYGKKGKTVIEVAHRDPNSLLYWHIDNNYIGKTEGYHQFAVNPELGKHIITVVDKKGNSISRTMEIVSK